ncbi:MAG: replication restart helicase PriA [Candidatus Acidiferrales bacterium]
MPPRYCEVALPVPLRTTFTYAVPPSLEGAELAGSRLVVPFRNRAMVGVGLALSDRPPEEKKMREIVERLDAIPALPPKLVELGRWVSHYYVAPIGETLRAMLPPSVELRHQREITLTDRGRAALEELRAIGASGEHDEAEKALMEFLESSSRPLLSSRAKKLPGGEAACERLLRRGCLAESEIATHRRARMHKIFAWNPTAQPATDSAKRIQEVLTAVRGPLPLAILLEHAKVSRSVLTRLEKQGKLQSWEEPPAQEEDSWYTDYSPPANVLNAEQHRASEEIARWLASREYIAGLLHGVTGSGKTEVYLAAIGATLAQGRAAIVLVPEIALTLWLSRQVRARFGNLVAVLHSGLADTERAREWWRARRGEARIVVGTRSAVFAPVENLGLIIVDEEQESSYKQEETPRYHGRDTALVRAKLESAVALLGSATPSLESFHHVRMGKYRLLELSTRVENRPLASVRVVDLREDFRHSGRARPLSESLRAAIARCLEQGTQAMVLINRRGYSWFLLCRSCGAHVGCQNCSIALVYHKKRARLECHYCGYSERAPKICPKCRGEYLYFVGEGAERIEEYLREEFPRARIGRLDRDSVRTKREYQQVLGAFATGELDLLVGTQMVAKGHDFERVTLVGVVGADIALGRPDFRAAERTFQLLTQVAGRAGRGRLLGEVLVETYCPEHYSIQDAARQDYASFFERELNFRRMLHYPPITALALVLVRDRKLQNAIRWSRALAGYFAGWELKGIKVLGPAAAPLARLRQEFRFQFLLKTTKRSLLVRALSGCLDFCAQKEIPETAILVDMDPVSLM